MRLKEEMSEAIRVDKYEKNMKLYIMAKIKNRFNDIKFHRCEKCDSNNFSISVDKKSLICYLYTICEVKYGFLILICHGRVDSEGNILINLTDNYIKKECNGYPHEPTENIQAQKIIAYRKEITNTFTNLCHKMYYTDELILLQKQYYTFLLSSRKTFPRDIRILISQKILFFIF